MGKSKESKKKKLKDEKKKSSKVDSKKDTQTKKRKREKGKQEKSHDRKKRCLDEDPLGQQVEELARSVQLALNATQNFSAAEAIDSTSSKSRAGVIEDLVQLSRRVGLLIERVSSVAAPSAEAAASVPESVLLERLLQDVRVSSHLPASQKYVEMGLRKRVGRLYQVALHRVSPSVPHPHAHTPSAQPPLQAQESSSFADVFRTAYTDTFGDDLFALREEEPGGFSAAKLGVLRDCIHHHVMSVASTSEHSLV
eukprot:gnl/Spiro4/6073_TR3114_c0_g2_i1.p1 gnl/Spiro4/6073_TR3114_c0_g2~~gnl/Spiro4/6073_TR3114_c0_g2_i1.p1  ORF type:complete len:253 (-),score=75.44 gnl/Spiro4/6073_TR3114_c0_g2_i1:16-774(-)